VDGVAKGGEFSGDKVVMCWEAGCIWDENEGEAAGDTLIRRGGHSVGRCPWLVGSSGS